MPSDFVHDPGKGSLHKNEFKKEKKHPEYKGDLTAPDGKQYEISAWVSEYRGGEKKGQSYMSLRIQPPYKQEQTQTQQRPVQTDDDIPF
jgi:hypothetical protein